MSHNWNNSKNIYLFLLICLLVHQSQAARQNSFKINTDLTASVIDSGGPSAGGVVASDYGESKLPQNEIEQTKIGGNINNSNSNITTHICTREETYVEQLQIPNMQPVRVRSSSWCLEFPPRCSNYKTEMRQVMQVKNVTKTRTIRFCCDGYEASTISLNDTVCKPVCRGGCGRGHCEMPDVCTCEAGYIGKHCTQRCDHDHWGLECQNECQCQNGAACDNKSGICHCLTGWTGDYCEQPCPPGTHGVMCRKACECSSKHCHPQTGACEEYPANATHVLIANLNSTIANITHNLDRLTKNIVNIAPSATGPNGIDTLLLPEDTAVTVKTLPEVIVIKQDETANTPKIIVHQQGTGPALLDTLHNAVPKSPEVIHVITGGWPNITNDSNGLHLAGFGGTPSNTDEKKVPIEKVAIEKESSLLSTLLIILSMILIAVVVGFFYVYRRYHKQKAQVEAALATRSVFDNNTGLESGTAGDINSGSLGKSFLKPLPDLPAFTQMMRNKIEAHEYYDSPQAVHTPPYTYARKESLYSIVTPKSRRGSPDSHLYDEIRYPTAANHHHHHHNPHQLHPNQHLHHSPAEQHLQHSTYGMHKPVSHHVTQLIIPPQNSKYLQVPQMTYTTHKVAHM